MSNRLMRVTETFDFNLGFNWQVATLQHQVEKMALTSKNDEGRERDGRKRDGEEGASRRAYVYPSARARRDALRYVSALVKSSVLAPRSALGQSPKTTYRKSWSSPMLLSTTSNTSCKTLVVTASSDQTLSLVPKCDMAKTP